MDLFNFNLNRNSKIEFSDLKCTNEQSIHKFCFFLLREIKDITENQNYNNFKKLKEINEIIKIYKRIEAQLNSKN